MMKKNPSQTFYVTGQKDVNQADNITIDKAPFAQPRGSVNIPTQNNQVIDVHATVRTDDQDKKSGGTSFFPILVDSGENSSMGLSRHEKKEAEIYNTMASMPNRNITMVDQKSDEQIKLEAEYKLHKAYNRLSLPRVEKRR